MSKEQHLQKVEQPKKELAINFETEATVGVALSRDSNKEYFYQDTAEPAHDALVHFSLMKFGSLPSVRFFGSQLAQAALRSEKFIAFLAQASREGKQVFITAPSIYNVPSASNLLLRDIATRLNIRLSKASTPTVVIREQIKLTKSDPTYAQQSIQKRQAQDLSAITPKEFEGNAVIFLDDLYNSGSVARKSKAQFHAAGITDLHFLFGARMDEKVVLETNGSIENEMNRYYLDGSLNRTRYLLDNPFSPVQKTLRDVFAPRPAEILYDYFSMQVSDEALVKLYVAAALNDFRNLYPENAPAILVLEKVLEEKNILDLEGNLII